MNRPALRFWASAVAVALAVAIFSALLLPFDAIGLVTRAERQRAWLLTLWTGGVMAVLFGASALLGAFHGLGLREVLEAGSLQRARDARTQAMARARPGFHSSFGWWLVSVGALLILGYFAAAMVIQGGT